MEDRSEGERRLKKISKYTIRKKSSFNDLTFIDGRTKEVCTQNCWSGQATRVRGAEEDRDGLSQSLGPTV